MRVSALNEYMDHILPEENPLSGDIIIVHGKDRDYIFDMGNSEEIAEYLNSIRRPKTFVVSHFHEDHIGSLKYLKLGEEDIILAGAYTKKYIDKALVVSETKVISDGIKLEIRPLTSSHAKGCLVMLVNDEYAFLGDATYSQTKDGKNGYNAQLLKAEVDELNAISCQNFCLSHKARFVFPKKFVVGLLERFYKRRDPNSSFIEISEEG